MALVIVIFVVRLCVIGVFVVFVLPHVALLRPRREASTASWILCAIFSGRCGQLEVTAHRYGAGLILFAVYIWKHFRQD